MSKTIQKKTHNSSKSGDQAEFLLSRHCQPEFVEGGLPGKLKRLRQISLITL